MVSDLPTYAAALERALSEVDTAPTDGAAVRLAYGYATELDQGGDHAKVGPLLLACLAALLLTPSARAAATKGVPVAIDKPGSRLDELRERRARKGRASDMDAANA
jgi:hypothetical protein